MLGATVFFVVILAFLSTNNTALSRVLGLTTQTTPTSSPTVTPLPTNTPIPTPTTKYVAPKPTVDPDPLVACNIHKDCGGGSVQLKSSVCSNSTCCQVGDKWIFYQSKQKCTQDQNAQNAKYNTPPIVPKQGSAQTGSSSEPLITCVLSTGTYRVFQSTCDKEKQKDREDQERQYVQGVINQLENESAQYQQEEQRKLNLEACQAKAKSDEEKMLQWESTQNFTTDLIRQQIYRNGYQAREQCHTLYGY